MPVVGAPLGAQAPFHPLPTPSVELYERMRVDEPLDSLHRSHLRLDADFGAWQQVGDEIWFGVSYYLGEGSDGVGGFGRFDPATGRFRMTWDVPKAGLSVSALHHDGEALWLGLFRLEGGRFVRVRDSDPDTDPASSKQEATVARANHDFDHDGRTDTLEIVLLDGRRYDDTTAWCGAGDKFEGRFAVRVHLASGSTTRFALPEYTFFRAPGGEVVLEDYNGDGRADFNLGQYATCNGWRYRLYTVGPSGEVQRLPVGDSPDAWLPVNDVANSTDEIVTTRRGFRACHYDNASTYTVRWYAWHRNDGRFVRTGEQLVEGCPDGDSRVPEPPTGQRRNSD